ncbi:hypothetical protein B0T17DRAFT_641273 [Bombardia bombarda]|uniref:Uncharacterized protein n=1 Tax=Bombardia bombarda TaxID=252184 RepID=A0AA40C1M0_9PEZI|nr:hypothetical protein B0T17DRAFT_641273 [Bombardia bombarda]
MSSPGQEPWSQSDQSQNPTHLALSQSWSFLGAMASTPMSISSKNTGDDSPAELEVSSHNTSTQAESESQSILIPDIAQGCPELIGRGKISNESDQLDLCQVFDSHPDMDSDLSDTDDNDITNAIRKSLQAIKDDRQIQQQPAAMARFNQIIERKPLEILLGNTTKWPLIFGGHQRSSPATPKDSPSQNLPRKTDTITVTPGGRAEAKTTLETPKTSVPVVGENARKRPFLTAESIEAMRRIPLGNFDDHEPKRHKTDKSRRRLHHSDGSKDELSSSRSYRRSSSIASNKPSIPIRAFDNNRSKHGSKTSRDLDRGLVKHSSRDISSNAGAPKALAAVNEQRLKAAKTQPVIDLTASEKTSQRTELPDKPRAVDTAVGAKPPLPLPLPSVTAEEENELFRMFASKQKEKRQTRIINGSLPTGGREGGAFIPPDPTRGRPPGRKANQNRHRTPVTTKPSASPLRGIDALLQQGFLLPPQKTSKSAPAPRPPPARKNPAVIVPAGSILGETTPIKQWVVYRTPKFIPEPGETKADKATRCTAYLSKRQANKDAQQQHSRWIKGVTKKSWEYTSDKGLFDSSLEFDSGDVQYYWVIEELTDLSTASDRARAAGGSLCLDAQAASIYTRQRYDVWSMRIYPNSEQVVEQAGKKSQVIVMDCRDEEEGQEAEEPLRGGREVSEAPTVRFPSHSRNPLDLLSPPENQHHGSFTTLALANEAAQKIFIDLLQPRNSRIEDHHYYKYYAKPQVLEQFAQDAADDDGARTPLDVAWEPRADGLQWYFLRLQVKVVVTELKGPVDIGDMVVDGGPVKDDDGQTNVNDDGPSSINGGGLAKAPPILVVQEDSSDASEAE